MLRGPVVKIAGGLLAAALLAAACGGEADPTPTPTALAELPPPESFGAAPAPEGVQIIPRTTEFPEPAGEGAPPTSRWSAGLRRCPRSDSGPGARVRGAARGRRRCRRPGAVPQDSPRRHDGGQHPGARERHNDEQGQLRGQGARGDVRRPRGRRDNLRRIRGQHPDGLVHAGGGRAERHRPARRPVDRIDLPWREPDACDRGGVRERWRRACGDPGVPGAGTGRHSAERDRLRRVQADRRRAGRSRRPGPVRRGP